MMYYINIIMSFIEIFNSFRRQKCRFFFFNVHNVSHEGSKSLYTETKEISSEFVYFKLSLLLEKWNFSDSFLNLHRCSLGSNLRILIIVRVQMERCNAFNVIQTQMSKLVRQILTKFF